ncbi:MAG: zinc-ribbon domain-containing protein [Oscillospiraceae bacterium]
MTRSSIAWPIRPYSARYAPPAPPAYIPPAAGQQPQGSAGANVQYCPICGQAAPKSARFCNNCGTKLDGSTL